MDSRAIQHDGFAMSTRRAQKISRELDAALRLFCHEKNSVMRCFVVDGRIPEDPTEWLVIALGFESESDLEAYIERLRELLKIVPERERVLVMHDTTFVGRFHGGEFFKRSSESL